MSEPVPAAPFIAFEGGEGAGKSTQIKLLSERLKAECIDHIVTREPGGTPAAEAIRELLLSGADERWNARSEALLFAAARADHVARVIRPALAAGQWVLCDRFVDSSRAYQSAGQGLDDAEILQLHQIGSEGLFPDLTILLKTWPDIARERVAKRDGENHDRFQRRDEHFHSQVADAFERIGNAEPERFALVAGEGSPEDVHKDILAHLKKRGYLAL